MITIEIIKRGEAKPLSNRRNQQDVVIEYVIARSNGDIFTRIIGKRRLSGAEFTGGKFGAKYYSLTDLAPYISQMPGISRNPSSSYLLKDALPPNNNISGAIVAILRAEGVLMSSPPSVENYAYTEVGYISGCRSWRDPHYSIDRFLEDMLDMDALEIVEVPESKVWRSPNR